jgi:TPR repeat protein
VPEPEPSAAELLKVGETYVKGEGVSVDLVKAAGYFRRAADLGDARGQLRLGEAYNDGAGVEKDRAEALRWINKATAQGEPRAEYLMALATASGDGVPKDMAAAYLWCRKSAEGGNADAQFDLGVALHDGADLKRDDAEAARWFGLAAKQGHHGAMNNLGWLYLGGKGVTRDEREAVRLFRAADEPGSLAFAYDYGVGGLAPDAQRALALYKKQGNEWAMNHHKRLSQRLQCEARADTLLFGIKLKCGDREQVRFRLASSGAVATRESRNDWGDTYETSKVLSGSSSLYVGYTFDDWFAVAEYQFADDKFEDVGNRVISKYGPPRKTHGNLRLGPVSATWITKDGLEIEVHHGWPPTETFLTYKNPAAYRQMKAEQDKLKRKAEADRNRSESQAF